MTKGEREELRKIIAGRERLAGRDVEQRAAELRAEAEAQLAKTWAADDELWATVTAEADAVVEAANADLQAKARALGCPEEFLPRLWVGWSSRGQNSDPRRRAELRKVVYSRIDAMAAAARAEIASKGLAARERLALGVLSSEEAKVFLAEIPTPQSLMPGIDVTALKALKP